MCTFLKYPPKAVFLLLFLFFPLQHIYAAEKYKIAINDLDALGVPENIALSISDILRTELFNTGSFHVTERNQMNTILDEQKFQLSGATEEDIIAMGKLLSVQMMALGSINRLGGLLIINVRLVDIEEGRVRVAESERARGEEQLPDAIANLAKKLANSIPIQGKVLALENNKVIVSLGGTDGVRQGSAFRVQRFGASYIDPVNKKSLGRARLDIALMRVDEVLGESLSSASVVDEQKKILVGDFVTILSGDAVTTKQNSTPVFLPSNNTIGIKSSGSMSSANEALLRSNNPKDIKNVSNRVIKSGHFPPHILKIAQEVLLAGYKTNLDDRYHVDAMAWLCKLLGYSKNKDYVDTLEIIANETENKKIRKYATKMLSKIKQ